MPSFQSVIDSPLPRLCTLSMQLPLSETRFVSSISWMTPAILDVLVGVLWRNRTDKIFIYTFWRLSHMIVVVEILQAGEIGKLVVQFSLSPKVWEPGESMLWVSVWVRKPELRALMSGGRRRWMSQLRQRANSPFLCLLVLFSNGLDDAYLHWWGQSLLLSLQIQMLMSSRSTLRAMPKKSCSSSSLGII